MSYAQDTGYTPKDFQTLMDEVMDGINDQFSTTYTTETFTGTAWYKYAYKIVQMVQAGEIKTSEIFVKLQEYFNEVNASISRPAATAPGIIDRIELEGYRASIKPPEVGDAGKIYICIDINPDDFEDTAHYETERDRLNLVLSGIIAGGVVSQGAESTLIVLSNGQSFAFKYALPDRTEVLLRLTTTLSENNQLAIESPEDQKAKLLSNIAADYRLGKNFEPERYFSVDDAPWASDVILEWSDDDGANWHDEVFDADFDELFTILLANIQLVEN